MSYGTANIIKAGPICAILLFFIIAVSCVYDEDEVYYANIIPGTTPTVIILTNLDTIGSPEVSDSLEILYEVKVDSGEFMWTRFLLSDSVIFDSDSASCNFWLGLDTEQDSGFFSLDMEVYYSTNTGSLADIIGIEAFRETKQYNIWYNVVY